MDAEAAQRTAAAVRRAMALKAREDREYEDRVLVHIQASYEFAICNRTYDDAGFNVKLPPAVCAAMRQAKYMVRLLVVGWQLHTAHVREGYVTLAHANPELHMRAAAACTLSRRHVMRRIGTV